MKFFQNTIAVAMAMGAAGVLGQAPGGDCTPQSSPYPVSCVACKGDVKPVDVPFNDIRKMHGPWFVMGAESTATNPQNVCTQVNVSPLDKTNPFSKIDYFGYYVQGGNPRGQGSLAQGAMAPKSSTFSAADAPYQLTIGGFTTDFYFVATDGNANGDDITAAITLSCPQGQMAGFQLAQVFLWSRTPFFKDSTTYDILISKARQAVQNWDEHTLLNVKQPQGWCNHKWQSPYPSPYPLPLTPNPPHEPTKEKDIVAPVILGVLFGACFVGMTAFGVLWFTNRRSKSSAEGYNSLN